MARLRHFAVCVNDLDKAAEFYQSVFDLKRIGREDLEIGSAIYMSDGVINLALLNFKGSRGSEASDLKIPAALSARIISAFRSTILPRPRSASRPMAENFSSILATNVTAILNASSKILTASFSIFPSTAGKEPTATARK